jgi:small-conductance mechanosensitive channel
MVFDREGVRMPFPQFEIRLTDERKAEVTSKS